MKDFFISYNKADRAWAEWIAWTLEEAGHTVVIQAWDFRPGENFALKMQEAAKDTRHTIAVLSEDYLAALYTQPEWAAAFARDPKGEERTLIPVRVNKCEPEGVLGPIVYIDLVGRSEGEARNELLEGVLEDRAKPDSAPAFPTRQSALLADTVRVMIEPVQYPGTSSHVGDDSAKIDIPSNLPIGIPFFTGREEVLSQLHNALKAGGSTALAQRHAISGLGGIGKTQTAIEYARRHRAEYNAVLWAVAESRESLISDFGAIAEVLGLQEAKAEDQGFVVKAVRKWLENNDNWLLILDNADEPAILEEFLPGNSSGHLLLTSRAQVFDTLGILNPVELEEMTPDDARRFLLRRTGRSDLDRDEAHAVQRLAEELDYLPLALEQTGAYIKELRSSFQDYLASYQKRGLELLEKGNPTGKYRKSVRTTWSLNFQQVEQASSASADLLRVSAFMNPDRIPIELVTLGFSELGPALSRALENVDVDPLSLDEVLKPLIQYSLIHRNRESKTYDIHRLVQAVLKDGMNESTNRLWAERVVKGVATVFPNVDAISVSEWTQIERLLAHAQACVELINQWRFEFQEGAKLLNLLGRYLHLRGRLQETEPLYRMSLAIREQTLGPEHPDLATSLRNMAWLYRNQGKYVKGESLLVRALAIRERVLGPESRDVAFNLDDLGSLYTDQGRYRESDQILRRALGIREKVMGKDHPDVGSTLNSLAGLYYLQGRHADSESLTRRAVKIQEKALGSDHYTIVPSLVNLGLIALEQSRWSEAEAFFLRAVTIYETAFGPDYPLLATVLNGLGNLRSAQGNFPQADLIFARSLRICETGWGPDNPNTAYPIAFLAESYKQQKRFAEAESLYLRAIEIREKSLGSDHPILARTLASFANLYYVQRKYSKGEPLIRRAIPILKKALGEETSFVASAMSLHAGLLNGLNRKGEAQRLVAQARKIQAKLNKRKRN